MKPKECHIIPKLCNSPAEDKIGFFVLPRMQLEVVDVIVVTVSVCQSRAHKNSSFAPDTEADGGMSGVHRPPHLQTKAQLLIQRTASDAVLAAPQQDEQRQLPYYDTVATPYGEVPTYPTLPDTNTFTSKESCGL